MNYKIGVTRVPNGHELYQYILAYLYHNSVDRVIKSIVTGQCSHDIAQKTVFYKLTNAVDFVSRQFHI